MGTCWALFPGQGLWKQQQSCCPWLREPTLCIPQVILCPQWSLPPPTPTSWPLQVTPQHELDFTNPCGEGRHWVAKLLPSHGFRRAGQARGLARNAVTPARLVQAGFLQPFISSRSWEDLSPSEELLGSLSHIRQGRRGPWAGSRETRGPESLRFIRAEQEVQGWPERKL